MSGVGQSEDGVEASTSGMMETTMMEGEEYYNPDDTGTWAQKEMSDQLCRICAKPNQYLIPIFEGEGIEHQLEPKIQKHLPIEVSESDDLPLQVCYQCASTLIAWNDLVIACIEADKKLRQMHEQEEEDEDDKGAEFFDEPILDSDEGEDPVEPSTSIPTVASDMQSDATSHPKRSPGKAKKPKLKMTLVKSPTAGPSGQKSLLKRVASKAKEDAGQEATERMERQCPFPGERANCKLLHTMVGPGTDDCLKKSVNLKAELVQVPDHAGSFANIRKPYTYANSKQFKATKLGISCPASLTKESVVPRTTTCKPSNLVPNTDQEKEDKLAISCHANLIKKSVVPRTTTCKPSNLVTNADQEKGDKLGISCPANLTEERVDPFTNACKSSSFSTTSQDKAVDHTTGGNYAIRCLKLSALENTDKSVEHSPIPFVNLPTSKETILNPENMKLYPKPTAKVVKVSHIKWHAIKSESGAVYSCSCCGQKNIAINSVINHVQKKCISLAQVDEHKMYPHTLSLDLAPTASEATKVTLDHTLFKSVGGKEKNALKPVSLAAIKPQGPLDHPATGRKATETLLNDNTKLKHLAGKIPSFESENIDKDVTGASSSNKSTLDARFDNTNQSEAPSIDPVIVDVVSLSKPAVVGSPKRTYKYIIRNSSSISALATLNPKPNVYKCKNCKKVFKSMHKLLKHQDSCKHGKFLCLICGRSFSIKGRLTRHVETHGLSPATCTICGETFRNEMMLKTHSMLHTGEHPHKCSVCGEGFIFTISLQKHLRKEHGVVEKEFKCKQCSKSFTTERFLAQHDGREHSGTKSRRLCPICGKTYNKQNISSHMATHGPKKHACKLCGYKAYSAALLNSHILRHRNERNHICEKCGSSFYSMNELKRHTFNHHTDELPEQCMLCNKAFKFPTRLKSHMILVHRIIPEGKTVLSCEICRQPFLEECKLKDHMNIHTGARPYACDECGRRFRNLKTITTHKKIHSKSKDPKNTFPCEACNKTFKTHRTLYHHKQNVHVRGVPFAALVACDLCERSFPNLWVLNRHRLGAHSVIGPLGEGHKVKSHYECNFCKVEFKSQSDLLEHTGTAHGKSVEFNQPDEKDNQCIVEENVVLPSETRKRVVVNRDSTRPYGCDECDKNYASRIGLYQHRRLVHSRRPKPLLQTRKQYECNHCFKIFSSYGSLYQHRRFTHSTNIKPIPCVTCGKTFKLQSSLNAHMQTHLDDSDRNCFCCNICGRLLKTKCAYKVHVQQHMGIKRFNCDICGCAFARKYERDKHAENIHGRTLLLPRVAEEFSDMGC